MKSSTNYIAILFLILSAVACKKKKVETVSGIVIDQSSFGDPANVEVELISEKIRAAFSEPTVIEVIETVSTDEDGKFQFNTEFKRKARTRYYVQVKSSPPYFMPQLWEKGGYDQVSDRVEITDPSTHHGIDLLICKNGGTHLTVSNQSSEEVWVTCHMMDDKLDLVQFYKLIKPNGTVVSQDTDYFPLGKPDLMWLMEYEDGHVDTVWETLELRHGEVIPHSFVVEE